jgi:hypothetical protein
LRAHPEAAGLTRRAFAGGQLDVAGRHALMEVIRRTGHLDDDGPLGVVPPRAVVGESTDAAAEAAMAWLASQSSAIPPDARRPAGTMPAVSASVEVASALLYAGGLEPHIAREG